MSVDVDEDNNPFGTPTSMLAPTANDTPTQASPDATADPAPLTSPPHDDGDDADDLLFNNPGDPRYSAMVSINPESRVGRLLKPGQPVKAEIIDAGSSREGLTNSKLYVVYTIRLINLNLPGEKADTRRRYLDFVGLREILCKIFPLVIIPPIPPKNYVNLKQLVTPEIGKPESTTPQTQLTNGSGHTGTDKYSYINSTHLTQRRLVEHRQRLLQRFINNCLNIPQIRNLEFFHKFLDPNANWGDEVTLILSQLPKLVYCSNPENGLKIDPMYQHLPQPLSSSVKSLVKKGAHLLSSSQSEDSNNDRHLPEDGPPTASIMDTTGLDIINKRIMESFIGMAQEYADLGTAFNLMLLVALSDNDDTPKLNLMFDRFGQIFDRLYITINSVVADLDTRFSEPLGEVVQYTGIFQDIQKFQLRKIKQKLMVDTEIANKRAELEDLLQAEGQPSTHAVSATKSGFLLKKLQQIVTDIIDQNPEQTRKERIEYLKQKLGILEKCQGIMLEDLSYIADEINKGLELFKRQQLQQIYRILLDYNGFLLGWAKKNCDIWEDIREEIINL